MNRLLFFLIAFAGCVGIAYPQFVSVKQGDWSDPKTWSTNPESTAIPDSTSDVIVQHYVIVHKYYQGLDQRCKSLTILADGRITSYSHGEWLVVENNLINYGIIMPSYDFNLKVKGDMVNHGVVKNHYINSRTTLELHGNLINNGSFRKVTDLIFKGNGTAEHVHTIKSMNDSTIYLGDARISDALGKVVVDSVARLSSTSFDLYDGKLIIPAAGGQLYANNLYVRYGTLEANGNTIRSEFGALVLGNNYQTRTNTFVSNAVFDCTVSVGGGSSKADHVVLLGENTVRGLLVDWYEGNVWTAGDRGLRIAGKLTNEGKIRNATAGTGQGLRIYMEDGSGFINKNDSLLIKAMEFDGHCKFTNLGDTLDVEQWIGTDTATVVELTHSVWFDKTITIDLKGGKLILPSDGIIKTLYLWYNRMNNTRIVANGGGIQFAAIEKNCTFDEVSIRGVYCMEDVLFTGKTTVDTHLFPYEYKSPVLTFKGDFENKGNIRNHPSSGNLLLHLNADVFSTGTEWSNYETRLKGSQNQHLIIPGTSYLTGKVCFDAMITGAVYQWQKNGVDIPDATASTLTFATGINASHFGLYQCIVDGTTPSRTIFVGTELPPPPSLKIKGITDVPADQGGWVHIHFEAHPTDASGEITQYGIWQWRVDKWISMGHVPAIQQSEYTFLAHTYADSTSTALNWSKFYITAHTTNPLVYFTCAVDSGYSIDNLIPSVPTGLLGFRSQHGTELSWNANPDPDVQYYEVYRNDELIGLSETNAYIDKDVLTGSFGGIIRYAVAAVDFSGNKSQPSPSVQVEISSLGEINAGGMQLFNTPNPFIDNTMITFTLNEGSKVEISVTDLTGKLIRVLEDREYAPGVHQVGFNAAGLNAGVYLCRLRSISAVVTRKMILSSGGFNVSP
jgi:hypothetical protein